MKHLLIAALLAAPLGQFAAPAQAADLIDEPQRRENRMGGFAGARLRIAIGDGQGERVRAGLTIAPTLHRMEEGRSRLRIGEGVEYGVTDRKSPGVSVAGYRISEGHGLPEGRRHNVSTLGWVAIGAGVVLVAGVGVLGWLVHEADQNTE